MKEKIYKLVSSAKQGLLAIALTVLSGSTYSQTTNTFSYTGSQQTLALSAGTYSISMWGGDGYTQTSGYNGKGGFSTGILTLVSSQTISINVGGLGAYPTSVSGNVWTFNGGGIGYPANNSAYGNGGGASDVRLVGGTWNNAASLASRVIVAGGGGAGRSSSYIGGNGGALTGGTGTYFSPDQTGGPTGGTQTSGGSNTGYTSGLTQATVGAAMTWDGTSLTANFLAGGGGGYYGGASGRVAGGGGSSYIGGVSSGTTIMIGQPGFVANPVVNGNGYVIITGLCNITLSTNASNSVSPSICSGQSLTLTTNAVSNFSWSTGQTTSSIVVSPTISTVYSISGTSSLACTASASRSITVSSGLPVLSISNPSNNICLGMSTSLTASGAITYTWSGGILNGVPFTPSATQTYTVSGQNGCGISVASATINVAPLSVSVSATPTLVCEGSTVALSATSSVSGYTWQPTGAFTASTVANPTALTVYTVTASDGTCSGVSTVTVATKTTPTVTATGSSSLVCENASLTLSAGGAQSYSWTPVNLTGQNITITPSVSTLYIVAGTNSLGCTSSANWVVVVNPAPPTTASTNKSTVCVGGQAVLSAGGASTYVWAGGPSAPGYSVNPLIGTTYTVTGTGVNGCTKNATVTVSVYDPILTLTSSTPAVCSGGNVNLTASVPGAGTYSWNGTGGLPSMAVSPSVTTVYTVSANSTSVVVCAVSKTIGVTVYPNPTVSIVATKTLMCKGDAPAILTAGGASSYLWASSSATTATISAPSGNASTVIYSVTGTDVNGCAGGGSIQVKVNSCVGIDNIQKIAGVVNVYPNPNTGDFTISTPGDTELKLVNELGQVIKQLSLNNANDHKVVLNGIAPGVYFIVGQTDRTSFNQKIVVTH